MKMGKLKNEKEGLQGFNKKIAKERQSSRRKSHLNDNCLRESKGSLLLQN